jgi:hypothetical protein
MLVPIASEYPPIYSYQRRWVDTILRPSFCRMSTGMQAPRAKLQERYPLLGSDVTAVSRLDERVDEAGFLKVSGHWQTSVPMNTTSIPVPTLSHFLVSHPFFLVVEMSEKFYSRLGGMSERAPPL